MWKVCSSSRQPYSFIGTQLWWSTSWKTPHLFATALLNLCRCLHSLIQKLSKLSHKFLGVILLVKVWNKVILLRETESSSMCVCQRSNRCGFHMWTSEIWPWQNLYPLTFNVKLHIAASGRRLVNRTNLRQWRLVTTVFVKLVWIETAFVLFVYCAG